MVEAGEAVVASDGLRVGVGVNGQGAVAGATTPAQTLPTAPRTHSPAERKVVGMGSVGKGVELFDLYCAGSERLNLGHG